MLLSALLIGAAGGITWRSLSLLQFGYGINPVGRGALLAACAVLAIKEGLFRYLLRVARRSGSSLLEASAWHARADALSSIVVAIGILGNLLGVTILDPIAAVVVAALLLRLGLRFGRRAFDALTDRALSADETAAIRATLATTQGVVSIHQLRTRQLGDDVIGDAHVQVAARVSVSEGHQIAEAARLRVVDQHGLSDFLVHIDAEDDGDHRIALEAPARNVVLDALRGVMPAGIDLLDASPLHYLDGQVDVDCLLRVTPAAAEDAVATLDGRLRQLEAGLPWLRSARVFVLLENRT